MAESINKVIVLGSGTSTGIPVLGCRCEVCTGQNPKNKRLRSSIFLQTSTGQQLLVDSGPDLRAQLLRESIEKVDGLILTHEHADHSHGIDDLRTLSYHFSDGLPVYCDARTHKAMSQRFSYLFESNHPSSVAKLNFISLPEQCLGNQVKGVASPFTIGNDTFSFFLNPHGKITTLSFAHSKMAYIIDCQSIDRGQIEQLKERQLDLLLIDCARNVPHPTHLHLEKALDYAHMIGAKSCGLTHLGHDFEHNQLIEDLKKRNFSAPIFPLYDGQVLTYG